MGPTMKKGIAKDNEGPPQRSPRKNYAQEPRFTVASNQQVSLLDFLLKAQDSSPPQNILMRVPYVLLFVVCIAIAACNALSAFGDYEHEVAATQNAQLRSSPRSLAAAETHDTSDKRLLRFNGVATKNDADGEERDMAWLTKTQEFFKTKRFDHQMRKYASKVKLGQTDDDIAKAWLLKTKSVDSVFKRWTRLGRSNVDTAQLLLKNGANLDDIFKVLNKRGMNTEALYKFSRDTKLDEAAFVNAWKALPKKAGQTDDDLYRAFQKAGRSDEDIAKALKIEDDVLDAARNENYKYWVGYKEFLFGAT